MAIDEVIDINPAKQDRFLACSGLKVSAPAVAMGRLGAKDNVFVMNSNYLDEIVALSAGRYTYISVDRE